MKTFNPNISISCLTLLVTLTLGCKEKPATSDRVTEAQSEVTGANPAMEGFNKVDSDEKAIGIADEVMKAMGGRKAWDEARYLAWDFFGARRLYWDKWTGDVRIEYLKEDTKMVLNVHDLKGKVYKDGEEVTQPDSLATYLKRGKSIWINDSYWLVMPFKLKDSGVTLTYSRKDTLADGQAADVLTLTFEGVGDTPQNKYEVFVDQADNLIKQWAFFRDAGQDSANFIRPWDNYRSFGKLLLSGNRSDNGGPTNVQLLDSLPPAVFTSLESVELPAVN
ncbi:MAG: hypothetical protein MI921_03665 [Cytophagales bacterium]|nr:hypothetical protein [Cytophagales bacterium]